MDRMSPGRETAGLVPRVLGTLVGVAASRPRWSLILASVLTILSLGVAFARLEFKTGQADLIDSRADSHQRSPRSGEKIAEQRDIVVVVEARDVRTIRSVLDDLGSRIEADPEHFQNTLYRIDPSSLKSKGLQYLSPTVLENVAAHLEVYAPVIEGQWQRAGLDPYCQSLGHFLTRADRAGNARDRASLIGQCQRLADSLDAFSRNPQNAAAFVSPWSPIVEETAVAPVPDLSIRYLVNARETMGFLVTMPRTGAQDSSGDSAAILRLRELVRTVQAEHETGDARIGITGIPVLESDERTQSQRDMSWATLFSTAGVVLILLIGFRGWRHPLVAVVMLAVGTAWAIGVATLTVGHVTIPTLSFVAILAGLGLHFTLHFLSQYLSLRHAGLDLIDALKRTGEIAGPGIVTCAFTTALAFGAAAFTSFPGVAELGILSATSIVCCGLAVFFVLPPLIALADHKRPAHQQPRPLQAQALRWVTREIPWPLAIAGVCLAIGCSVAAFEWQDGKPRFRVRYDGNVLNRQARGVESVQWQEQLFRESEYSLLHAVSMASSPAEARRLEEKFRALPSVSKVEHIASFIPAYPASETQLLVQAIHARLSRLTSIASDVPMVDPQSVGKKLDDLYTVLSQRGEPAAQAAAGSLDRFLDTLSGLPTAQQALLLNGYQRAMLNALHTQFARLGEIADPATVSTDELPTGLKSRFVGPAGDWVLRVFPKEQIWDETSLARFVADVRSIDPEITGTPLQNFEAAIQIRQSSIDAAIYALAVVMLVLLVDNLRPGPRCLTLLAPVAVIAFAVWIRRDGTSILDRPPVGALVALGVSVAVAAVLDLRNLGLALLAMLPALLGGGMLLGGMAVLDVTFNPANMLMLPLFLGIGVNFGVLVVHEFRASRDEFCLSGNTVNSLLLTAATLMVGFGTLLIASHRGLASLGLVLVVGTACVLFVALVPLSALLTAVSLRRQRMPMNSPRRLDLVNPPSHLTATQFSEARTVSATRSRGGEVSASGVASAPR